MQYIHDYSICMKGKTTKIKINNMIVHFYQWKNIDYLV